jgi:hypothetical protein
MKRKIKGNNRILNPNRRRSWISMISLRNISATYEQRIRRRVVGRMQKRK